MSSALHAHNKEVMRKLGHNGKKELYNHMKFLINKDQRRELPVYS